MLKNCFVGQINNFIAHRCSFGNKETSYTALAEFDAFCARHYPYEQILTKELAIGNNVHQLAVKANALGFIDAPKLDTEMRE
jgi:hypothetical protein